ncbi:Zinc finger protein 607 [Amphibalanus amphitrite]|uniref:Zinc finger protein 607 n=1 Tax=Amphibalanus amphitrite TaxID=1232801 RepID=A0A6A4VRK2_AMPAM|nr:zinc finger protein 628-like [Amphibalanus amphitrite]KAF0296313.1 Zinc finger protein 607 [Amphibalanus amphitrite]
MAASGFPASVVQWGVPTPQEDGEPSQASYVEPAGYSASNVLCVPMTGEASSPPQSENLCLLTPTGTNTSPAVQCIICGQYTSDPALKSSQLAPFSQRPSVELDGVSLEVSSVCHSCASLFQRVDYHYMLASRIRQGLNKCADAKHSFQVPGDFIQLQCSLCPAQVSDRRALAAHLSSHLQGDRLPCAACGRSFSGWQTLRRHALAAHQGALLSRCRRCPAAFSSSAKLVAHKLAQHGVAESLRRHRCPVCRRRFARAHRYAAHLRTHGAPAAAELRRTLAALAAGRTAERAVEPAPVAGDGRTQDGGTLEGRRPAEHRVESEEEWQRSDEDGLISGEDRSPDEPPVSDGDAGAPGDGCSDSDVRDSAAPSQMSATAGDAVGFSCDQCDKVFKRKQSLERHVSAMHKPSENLRCDECGKSFSIRFYWQKHMNRHRAKREQCVKCDRQFVNGRALKRHKCVAQELAAELEASEPALQTRTEPAPQSQSEPAPQPQLPQQPQLESATATGAGGPCPVCQCRLGTGEGSQGGLDPADGGRPAAPCTCGPSQPVAAAEAAVPSTPGTQYTCETCGESFATLARLSVHNRSHHEPRAHICRTCGAVFAAASKLRKHSSQHRERSYQCSVCGKCFRWKNNLDIHARIHADERPYQCDICGHATRCSANLRLHKQRVHSALRPHVCPLCQKGFKERYSMTIHMRSHTGDRPYVCEFCGDGFVTKGKLNSHMSKHSERRPHECPLCLKAFKTAAILGKHCRKVHGMTVEEAAARAGRPPPPPPPPEAAPLNHQLGTHQYLTG